MNDWISVEEKMPEDDTKVLSIGEDGVHVSFISSGQWLREGDQDNFCLFDVTHWMLLPGEPAQTRQTSEFSRFIREGTAEEKTEVFKRVIEESNKAQQDIAIFQVTEDDATDIYSSFHNPDGIYYLGEDQLGWYWQEHDGEPVGPFDTEQKAITESES